MRLRFHTASTRRERQRWLAFLYWHRFAHGFDAKLNPRTIRRNQDVKK